MKPLIRIAHKVGRGTYGPRRIQTELQSTGTFIGRDQIARLRREMRLRCIQKRNFKATTKAAHSLPVVENLLDQQFTVSDPGTAYGIHITDTWTDEGWLYLARCEAPGDQGDHRTTEAASTVRRATSALR